MLTSARFAKIWIDPKNFYKKVRPVGSQPARLYGLAKVHKKRGSN